MKTTGVSGIPKFGLLFFLGHPSPQVFNFLFSKFLSRSFGAYLYPFLRHENLVAGGDAGGRLRMASVVHGQQVGEHVEDGGEEGGD